MRETIDGLRNKSRKCNNAFESKGFKSNIGKTKTLVTRNTANNGLSKTKVYPYEVCSLVVKTQLYVCVYNMIRGLMMDVLE